MENHRLYRSVQHRVIGGVAGGLAEYFDIDPVIIRLVFVIVAFAGGGGLLVYLILWIVLPENTASKFSYQQSQPGYSQAGPPAQEETSFSGNPEWKEKTDPSFGSPIQDGRKERNTGGLIGGLVLITLGCLFLIDRFVPDIDFGDLWPILLVVIGAVLIGTNLSGKSK
jgi:phage shock protein PspC (stress-responsive transcriptional regulator)